jgi:hypothetical protein
MKLEPFHQDDLKILPSLQPEGWGDILSSFRFYLNSEFCYPFKISLEGQLAGTGTIIHFGRTAWLAHIIVHNKHRNKGIGNFITTSLVEFLKGTSCETIFLLATQLGFPVYKRVGFVSEGEYVFFKDGNITSRESNNVAPMQHQYFQQILELDFSASGENRNRLLVEHKNSTSVFLSGDVVSGFFVPTLGDGLIVANNTEAGSALMTLRNKAHDRFTLPEQNVRAIDFLLQHQFKEYQRGTRMRLGKPVEWNPTKYFNRIGGNMG